MTQRLTLRAASDAVSDLGWRLVLGLLRSCVPVGSLAEAAEVAKVATAACGEDADGHLRLDLRPDRVLLSVQTFRSGKPEPRDLDLAGRITEELRRLGLPTTPDGVQ